VVLEVIQQMFFGFKADAGVFNDAGATLATNTQSVRQWNDQSGNGKNFGETVAGQRPTFRTSIMNGFPTVRFDGNDDRLSNLTVTSGNTATFYVVVNYSSLPFPNPGILQGSPTGLLLSSGANDKVIACGLAMQIVHGVEGYKQTILHVIFHKLLLQQLQQIT
jgi:hypothetical protein